MSEENYENTHFYSAQDNGFTRVRRTVVDNAWFTRLMTVYANADDGNYYNQVRTVTNGIKPFMTKEPVSIYLTSRATGANEVERMYMDEDIYLMAAKSALDQCEWAITGERTAADINPPAIAPHAMGDISFVSGVNADGSYIVEDTVQEYLTFTGATYAEAVRKFNEAAMDLLFGDGMPLIPATRELVDEMLAATDRAPNDVLGKMQMRGGILTVEKVAINAVMCGVQPDAFPVVLAAAESMGNGWEENKAYWHPMTTRSGGQTMFVIVSGPIAEEIGMENDMGYNGAGNPVNNAIARTLRMLYRNIAHNLTPDIDTSWGYGRPNDYTFTILVEDLDALPTGWKSHTEILGFPSGSSSVTLASATSTNNMSAPINSYAFTSPSATANIPSATSGQTGLIAYPAAYAAQLAKTYATKEALMNTWNTQANTTAGGKSIVGLGRMVWPIVLTDGVNGYHVQGSYYNATTHQSQLVIKAGEKSLPTAPQDFDVTYNTESATATLAWKAPAYDGGDDIVKYQVYMFDGGQETAFEWIDVPGGADARSYVFNGLQPGVQYFFKVRAVNTVDNAVFYLNAGVNTHVNLMATPARLFKAPLERAAGHGGWALTDIYTPDVPIAGTIRTPLAIDFINMIPNYYNTYFVTFDANNNTDSKTVKIHEGDSVTRPTNPVYTGYRFLGWFDADGNEFNFSTAITEDITLTAQWEKILITSLKIDASALVSINRNTKKQFSVIVNDGALTDSIVWSVSNTSFATVDQAGNVTILNKMGTATLTAKDTLSGITHSIILRIV